MRKESRKSSWRYFRAVVNGRNFQLTWAEAENERPRIKRKGFYTTVHVRARSQKEAESRAMKLLRADKALRKSVRNPASDPPLMFLEALEELSSFKGCRLPRTGFAFYSERGPRKRSRCSRLFLFTSSSSKCHYYLQSSIASRLKLTATMQNPPKPPSSRRDSEVGQRSRNRWPLRRRT